MGAKAPPAGATARAFSTTGRACPEGVLPAKGSAKGSGKGSAKGARAKAESQPAVALLRVAGRVLPSLPERLELGGRGPSAITVGRHEENEAVLGLRAASKVHCQVALRSFRLPGPEGGGDDGAVHEAAFLRDNSRNGTLVNGVPAFRPWHWLQNGDLIGLRDGSTKPDGIINFFKVEYCSHTELPGHLVTTEDIPRKAANPAAVRRPGQAAPATVFGKELIGRIVDVRYREQEPPTIYRMRIVSFNKQKGWHHCDSKGLSLWDGESFDDTIDLNTMFQQGDIKFVDEVKEEDAEESEGDAPPLRPPQKKRRNRGG